VVQAKAGFVAGSFEAKDQHGGAIRISGRGDFRHRRKCS